MGKELQFLDLKLPVFLNKKTGQMSVTLPKKKVKKLIREGKMPKEVGVRIFKW